MNFCLLVDKNLISINKKGRKNMRATGIVRRIDELGRIVIPKEIRKKFGINEGDPLEIFVNKDEIILRKYDVSIGLKNAVKRLENEFFVAKNDMEKETADKIYEYINALREILNDASIE